MILMVYTIMVIITITYGLPTGPSEKSIDPTNVSIIQLNVYNHIKEHDKHAVVDRSQKDSVNTQLIINAEQTNFDEIKVDIRKRILYRKTLQELLIKLSQLLKLAVIKNRELDKKSASLSKDEVDIDESLSKVTEDNMIWSNSNIWPERDPTPLPIFPSTSSSGMEVTFPTRFAPPQNTVTSDQVPNSITTSVDQPITQLPQNNTTAFINSTFEILTTTSNESAISTQSDMNSTITTTSGNTPEVSSTTTSSIPYTTTKKYTKTTENFPIPTTKEAAKTTTMNWLKWCQNQCRLGTGGTACDCDIIP